MAQCILLNHSAEAAGAYQLKGLSMLILHALHMHASLSQGMHQTLRCHLLAAHCMGPPIYLPHHTHYPPSLPAPGHVWQQWLCVQKLALPEPPAHQTPGWPPEGRGVACGRKCAEFVWTSFHACEAQACSRPHAQYVMNRRHI